MKRPVVILLLAVIFGECVTITGAFNYLKCLENTSLFTVILGLIIAVGFISGIYLLTGHSITKGLKDIKDKRRITTNRLIWCVVILLFFVLGITNTQLKSKKYQQVNGEQGKNVNVIGQVENIQYTTYGCNVILKNCSLLIDKKKIDDLKIILQSDDNVHIQWGTNIRAFGKLKKLKPAFNIGNFDEIKYYKSIGVQGVVEINTAGEVEILSSGRNKIKEFAQKMRMRIGEIIDNLCDAKPFGNLCNEEKKGIFKAIIIGDKSQLTEKTKELYKIGGISHVLAISGLHISMIGIFIYKVLRRKFKFFISSVGAMSFVYFFILISGGGISGGRASGMFLFYLLTQMLGRKYDIINSMAFIALLMVQDNPFILTNTAFLMSYGAIVSIGLIMPLIKEFVGVRKKLYTRNQIEKQKHKIVKVKMYVKNTLFSMYESVIGSLSIQLILTPILAYNYYEVPMYSIIINILIVPMMAYVIGPVLWAIGICLIFGYKFNILSSFFIMMASAILECFDIACKLTAIIPGNNMLIGRPNNISIVLYFIILMLFLFGMKRCSINIKDRVINEKSHLGIIKRLVVVTFIYGLLSLLLMAKKEYGVEIIINNVGQGECIVIKKAQTTFMIDCGSTDVKNVMKNRIESTLKAKRIDEIDYLFITHTDKDHTSGLMELMEGDYANKISIRNIVFSKNVIKDESLEEINRMAKNTGINILYIEQGDEIIIEEMTLRCLYPGVIRHNDDKNDNSLVLDLSYKDFSMLFTGDISVRPEEEIMNLINKNYTMLKVAHHGSRESTSKEFIHNVKPNVALISCGINNSYGHPHKELLERLDDIKANIFRTDVNGQIIIKIKKDGDLLIKCACSD